MSFKYVQPAYQIFENNKSLSEIHDTIRRRNFPFLPSLYGALGMSLTDGLQNFADIVLEASNEFAEYNPPILECLVENIGSSYTFQDNFSEFLAGHIPAGDIVLYPEAIVHVMCTSIVPTIYGQVQSSRYWKYDNKSKTITSMWTNLYIKYVSRIPVYAELTGAKDDFTADSKVYLVTDWDFYIDQVSYNIGLRLKEYLSTVSFPGFSTQINVDILLQRLQQRVDDNRIKSRALYEKYIN